MRNQNAKELGLVEIGNKWFRKNKEGLEEMIMFDPIFGWLSANELFNLRQTDPRTAP